MNKQSNKKIVDKDIRELVIARLRSFSPGRKISIGSDGEFTPEELIEKVGEKDRVGDKIIAIELEYLRSLKRGIFNED